MKTIETKVRAIFEKYDSWDGYDVERKLENGEWIKLEDEISSAIREVLESLRMQEKDEFTDEAGPQLIPVNLGYNQAVQELNQKIDKLTNK